MWFRRGRPTAARTGLQADVFIAYGIALGILLGFLAGGRLDGLSTIRFHWLSVAVGGLIVQILIFGPLESAVGWAGTPLYVASTGAVLAAVIRNIRIPGLIAVVAGACSNLAAIVANGGIMPTDAGAAAIAGIEMDGGFSNSAVVAQPALRPLTDIFAIPATIPLANVFSIGDVLIAAGVVVAIVAGMRNGRLEGAVRADTSYE
jgi:hypothetical protein